MFAVLVRQVFRVASAQVLAQVSALLVVVVEAEELVVAFLAW